jgi:hypothetical protein
MNIFIYSGELWIKHRDQKWGYVVDISSRSLLLLRKRANLIYRKAYVPGKYSSAKLKTSKRLYA